MSLFHKDQTAVHGKMTFFICSAFLISTVLCNKSFIHNLNPNITTKLTLEDSKETEGSGKKTVQKCQECVVVLKPYAAR